MSNSKVITFCVVIHFYEVENGTNVVHNLFGRSSVQELLILLENIHSENVKQMMVFRCDRMDHIDPKNKLTRIDLGIVTWEYLPKLVN